MGSQLLLSSIDSAEFDREAGLALPLPSGHSALGCRLEGALGASSPLPLISLATAAALCLVASLSEGVLEGESRSLCSHLFLVSLRSGCTHAHAPLRPSILTVASAVGMR